MALEVPLLLQALTGDPAISYTAQQMRGLIDAVVPMAGVTFKDDLKVTQRGAGANMSVDVAAGQAAIRGTSIALQGTYMVRNTSTVNVAVTTANATNPRIDLIVARVRDKQADGGTAYSWAPEVVTGTAAATPVAPAVPVSSIVLAQVAVPANAVSVVTANITDKRTLNTLGDVPLWQLTGGHGQSIPNGADTIYAGTASDLIGMDTTATTGEVVVRTPGRYLVTHATRIVQGGTVTTERNCQVQQIRNGSLLRRAATAAAYPNAHPNGIALAAAGTARCLTGDVLKATVFQNSGGALTLTDTFQELTFTGVWVGP